MKKVLLSLGVLAMLAVPILLTLPSRAPAGSAQPDSPRTSHVVLVLAPGLRWEDISATSTPQLWELAREGAVGDINSRSRTRLEGEEGSPLEGALTISAGSWASPAPFAPAAYDVSERYEGGTAGEGYRRIMGRGSGYAAVAFLGLPFTQRYNDELALGVHLGTLGQAIVDAGGTTAAVGNSDAGAAGGSAAQKLRPAALAAMDGVGLVRFGDVSTKMLKADSSAPYGTTTDMQAIEVRLREIADGLRPERPNLTVIDPGDTYRAARIAPVVADDVAGQHRARAFQVLDRIVGVARGSLGDGGVLIVASQVPGVALQGAEGFGPAIVFGPGWSGYLTSSSTHRVGMVTNLDLTATILEALGVPEPVAVEGNPLRAVVAPVADARVGYLRRLNETAIAIDSGKTAVANDYIIATTLLFLLCAFALLRARRWSPGSARRWSVALRALLLAALAVPPASWLMFAIARWPSSAAQAEAVLAAVALGLWAIAILLLMKSRVRVPVAFLSLSMAFIAMADQTLGAPLSFSTFLGYSPLAGARYYGMGNESAAALIGASLLGLAYLMDEWPASSFSKAMHGWGVPIFGLVVIASASAPFLGANVGVIAWGVVGFGLFWILINGRRLGWGTVGVGLLIIVAIVGVFSAIDLLGGRELTHLGRALLSAERGGPGQIWKILVSKAQTNLRVFTATRWIYVLVVVLAFLAFMRWRPQGEFAATLRSNTHLASAITAILSAGAVAFFTEDSGIVIPAIMLIWVGAGILYAMLSSSSELPRRAGAQAESAISA